MALGQARGYAPRLPIGLRINLNRKERQVGQGTVAEFCRVSASVNAYWMMVWPSKTTRAPSARR